MAIEIKDPEPPKKRFRRTWQILISTPVTSTPDQYSVTWQRSLTERHAETGEVLSNKDYANDAFNCPSKRAGELMDKSWTLHDKTVITGPQIMEALALAGDEFDQELQDNPPQGAGSL